MSPVATMSRGVLPRSRYDEEEDMSLPSIPKEQQAGTFVPIRDWLQRRTTMPEPQAAPEQEQALQSRRFVPVREWLESRTAMPRPTEQPQEMAQGVPVKAEREIVPKVRPKVWTDPTKYKKDDQYQGLKPWLESSLDPQVDSNLKRMTAMLGEPPTIERNKRIEQYRARVESQIGTRRESLLSEREMLPKTPLEHLEPMLREESFSGDVLRTMSGATAAVSGMGHAITQGLSELPLVEGIIPKKVISWIDTHARELAEFSAINSEEIGRQGGMSAEVAQRVGEQTLTTAIRLAAMKGVGLLQSKSIIANAVKMGLFTAATTPGDLKERTMSGVRTATLMSTPVVSGLMPSNTLAVLLDAGLNIGLSSLYGFYDWKDPKSWIPALVMDIGFAASTRADAGAYDRATIAGKTYLEAAETLAFPSLRTAGKNLGMTPAQIDKFIADIKAAPPVADAEIRTQVETQVKQAKTEAKAPHAEEMDRATKDGRIEEAEVYRGFIEAIEDARDAQELGQIKAVIDEINTGRKAEQEALSAKPEGAIRDGSGSESDNANKAALSRELGEQTERRPTGEEAYQERMASLEREGQEVGRPLPVGGPGGQAAEAGRILPAQRRTEEQRVAEQKVEEVAPKEEPVTGTKAVAQRIVNAENRFIEFAMKQGDLTREQAIKALEAYKKAKAVKIDPIGGQFNLTRGDFANKDVLRRAAGIEAPESRVEAEAAVKPPVAGEREVLLKRPDEEKAKPLAKQPALLAGFDTRNQVSKTVEDTQKRFKVTPKALEEMSKILTGNADYTKAKVSDQVKLIAEIRKQRPGPGERLKGGEPITLKTEHRIDEATKGMTKRGELTPEYYDDIKAQLEIPDPRYVSNKQYATQRNAEELLDILVNIAPSLKEQIRIDRAKLENPSGAEYSDRIERARAKRRAEQRPKDRKVGMFRKLMDARYFYDFLEERTGLPFGRLHRTQAEHKHLADATHDKTITGAMKGIDKSDYKKILLSKESEERISDYITTNLLMGEKVPEIPANEKKVADYWIGVLKAWENPVRWLRFTEWRKNPKKYAIFDAPKSDLEEATRLLEVEGEAAARKYLDGKTWGVMESGYAPIEVIRNSILPARLRPGVSTANLQARRALRSLTTKESDQSEDAIKFDKSEQRNIFQRLISYDRRMNYLINLRSDVEAMDALWKLSADQFDRQEGVGDLLKQNMSELLGHREPAGPLERYVFNIYAQAARTIFFDVGRGVRNLFQPEVFQTGWLDLYRATPLSNERREWMETNVLQNRGITQDFLYSQYPGWSWFRPLNRIVDTVNVMGTTDSINRARSFKATISRVDRALAKHPKWNDTLSERNKMFKAAALGDLTVTQGKHANDILMADGAEAFARYVAAAVTQKHQAVYERFQRGLGEQGTEFRRAFSNLFVFPKMLAQRHILDAKKITSLLERQLGKPIGAPGRAAHSIIGSVAMGVVASSLYQLITGSKRRPYDPQQILMGITSFGGLAVGAQQKIGSLASNVLQALQGDEAALSRAMKEITVVADMFIPFYTQVLRAYEGIGGYNNADRAILRQIRSALDKRYNARGREYYKRERTLIESGQHAIFGTQIEMPEPKKKYPVGRSALPAARTGEYLKEQSKRSQAWRSRMPEARK